MSIEDCAKVLKLPYIRENHEAEITRAEVNGTDPGTFLKDLLEKELANRRERSIQNRIKHAKLPYHMAFDDFQLDHLSADLQRRIRNLSSLDFIENKENVILIGNPGVGKTALSICLAYKACLRQKRVLFINVSDLLLNIREALSQNQITRYKRQFANYDLVVLDELGFVSFDRESGEILFNLLSSRNEKGSIIITSNLTVDKWNDIFHDPVMTTAIVDRLAFKSHLIDMTGESYRVKTTKEWQKASGS